MKIWVITATQLHTYGGKKKLIQGFTTQAEARRIVDIIDECEPRLALDIEEIEVGVDLARDSVDGVPLVPAVSKTLPECVSAVTVALPENPPSNGPVVYDEPMAWQMQDGR